MPTAKATTSATFSPHHDDNRDFSVLETQLAAVWPAVADKNDIARLAGAISRRLAAEQPVSAGELVLDVGFTVFGSAGAALSLAAVVAETASSGWSRILGLLVTDTAAVLASWREFAFSVLEATPAMSLFGLLASSFFLIFGVGHLIRHWRQRTHYGVARPLILA